MEKLIIFLALSSTICFWAALWVMSEKLKEMKMALMVDEATIKALEAVNGHLQSIINLSSPTANQNQRADHARKAAQVRKESNANV